MREAIAANEDCPIARDCAAGPRWLIKSIELTDSGPRSNRIHDAQQLRATINEAPGDIMAALKRLYTVATQRVIETICRLRGQT